MGTIDEKLHAGPRVSAGELPKKSAEEMRAALVDEETRWYNLFAELIGLRLMINGVVRRHGEGDALNGLGIDALAIIDRIESLMRGCDRNVELVRQFRESMFSAAEEVAAGEKRLH